MVRKKKWERVNNRLYGKKADAKKKAKQYKNLGYNVSVRKGKTQVGTSKKSTVKGYKVYKDINSYRISKDKSRH